MNNNFEFATAESRRVFEAVPVRGAGGACCPKRARAVQSRRWLVGFRLVGISVCMNEIDFCQAQFVKESKMTRGTFLAKPAKASPQSPTCTGTPQHSIDRNRRGTCTIACMASSNDVLLGWGGWAKPRKTKIKKAEGCTKRAFQQKLYQPLWHDQHRSPGQSAWEQVSPPWSRTE